MTSPPGADRPTRFTWYFRLSVCCLVLVALAFIQRPGRLVSDTKFDLVVDPGAMLARAAHLWDPSSGFGQVQNQAYGYLFPMGPFFWLGDLVSLPGWVTQRLWWSLLLVTAFLGVVKLSGALGLRSPTSRILAGFAYALSPRILTTIGPISIEAWPMALAPWVLVPLVLGCQRGSPRRAAALSALAVGAVGGVNAAATFAVIPLGVVWILTRERGLRRGMVMRWWPPLVVVATLWWLVPLLLLGRYSPPFLDFIESASITTVPTGLGDVLRGTSHWVPYVDPTWQAGNDLITTGAVALNLAVLVGLGLVGLCLPSNPHRRFLVLGLLCGVVLVSLGHVGEVHGWFAGAVQQALDGALAPLRNVHKFEPIVRLVLVLGLAHLVEELGSARTTDYHRVPSLSSVFSDGAQATYVGVLALSVAAVLGVASPALGGRLAPTDDFEAIPDYWVQAASWLEEQTQEEPVASTTLLLPGSSFATYVWGTPEDEPVQALDVEGWAVRNAVPLAPAGNIRMLGAIEERLADGHPSAGLAGFLRRAGVSRVVLRNDLRPSNDVPSPARVHQAIEGSPGFEKVATFGPRVGGRRSIEVFDISGASQAVVSDEPPTVVGDPTSLLDLMDAGLLADQPTVLASDAQTPPRGELILTDGLRRRDVTFARVHEAASATLAVDEDGGRDVAARDYLVEDQERWESTAQLLGARSVEASSSRADAGSGGPVRPGALPYAAFDGQVDTAWESGSPRSREELPWIRVDLAERRLVDEVTVVAGESEGRPTQPVVVETEAGSSQPTAIGAGSTSSIAVPRGETSWIKVSGTPDARLTHGLTIAEVRVKDLHLQRSIVLPEVPEEWGAPDHVLLSSRTPDPCVTDRGSLHCTPGPVRLDEGGDLMDRTIRVGVGGDYDVEATVRPRASDALTGLIMHDQFINIEASSTAVADARGSAVAAIDDDAATTWIPTDDDSRPTLSLNWIGRRTVSGIALTTDRRAEASRPTEVEVIHAGGRQKVRLDRRGRASLEAFRATSVEVRILDAVGERVGVSELRLPGVGLLPIALSEAPRDTGCGFGPTLRVDGQLLATSVVASARDLFDGASLPARVCGPSTVSIAPSSTRVVFAPAPAFRPERIALSLSTASTSASTGRPVRAVVSRESPASSEVTWQARTDTSLVTLRHNVNRGWAATLPDGAAAEPAVVDGWQQGWWVPADADALQMEFRPDPAYRIALMAGGALLLLLAMVTLLRRRWSSGPQAIGGGLPAWPVPVVGGLAIGAVGGWTALACGVVAGALAVVARRRLRATTVAWLAAVPIGVVGAIYWARPLGSDEGWAGAMSAPHLLVAVALGVVLSVDVDHGALRWRNRIEGRSTPR